MKERILRGTPEAALIEAQIDAIIAVGASRRLFADFSLRALRPTEIDWLTANEAAELYHLQSQLREKSADEAKAALLAKRLERLKHKTAG